MKIRLGYELVYNCPQPVPMILMLHVHPSRISDLLVSDRLVTDPADIPRIVAEAFHVATTGRPGPVLVDVPKDVSTGTMEWYWPESLDLPGYRPASVPDREAIQRAAELINAAAPASAKILAPLMTSSFRPIGAHAPQG